MVAAYAESCFVFNAQPIIWFHPCDPRGPTGLLRRFCGLCRMKCLTSLFSLVMPAMRWEFHRYSSSAKFAKIRYEVVCISLRPPLTNVSPNINSKNYCDSRFASFAFKFYHHAIKILKYLCDFFSELLKSALFFNTALKRKMSLKSCYGVLGGD